MAYKKELPGRAADLFNLIGARHLVRFVLGFQSRQMLRSAVGVVERVSLQLARDRP